jgi:hypothetical protein
MAKEQIFSDILCLNITPEMRGRLNRFIAERCGHYAQTAPVVRDLINTCLTYYGYPPEAQQPQPQALSPQAQVTQPQPTVAPPPFPSPFAPPPMNGSPHARP